MKTDFEILKDLIDPTINQDIYNNIKSVLATLPSNYSVEVKLTTEFDVDKFEKKNLSSDDKLVGDCIYSGRINYGGPNSYHHTTSFDILYGNGFDEQTASKYPDAVKDSIRQHQLIQDCNPVMRYALNLGYKSGNAGYGDPTKMKEVCDKIFNGLAIIKKDSKFNPQFVLEYKTI